MTVQLALANAASFSNHQEHFEPLHAACGGLVEWLGRLINDSSKLRSKGFETFEGVWAGQEVGTA